MRLSILEFYMEELKALLADACPTCRIRQHPTRGVYVEGLTEVVVASAADARQHVGQADMCCRARHGGGLGGSTLHRTGRLFTLGLQLYKVLDSSELMVRTSQLRVVDLPRSERVPKTSVHSLREAAALSRTMHTLGACIQGLVNGQRHTPFRDSKLTHLLRSCLGGPERLAALVVCSPADFNCEETVSTLRFAEHVRKVENVLKQCEWCKADDKPANETEDLR